MKKHVATLQHSARLDGIVNGERIALRGRGDLDLERGVVRAEYEILSLPRGFSPLLFSAMLITGHPEVSRPQWGATNPFKESSQSYTRQFRFLDGRALTFHARCVRTADGIDSTFSLSGDVDSPALVAVEPLVEIWVPAGSGRIHGNFYSTWRTEDGELFEADVLTKYHIDSGEAADLVQHRFVTIQIRTDGRRLTQHQQSTLFPTIPTHEAGSPLDYGFLDS